MQKKRTVSAQRDDGQQLNGIPGTQSDNTEERVSGADDSDNTGNKEGKETESDSTGNPCCCHGRIIGRQRFADLILA